MHDINKYTHRYYTHTDDLQDFRKRGALLGALLGAGPYRTAIPEAAAFRIRLAATPFSSGALAVTGTRKSSRTPAGAIVVFVSRVLFAGVEDSLTRRLADSTTI